jgi:hypothetical protein
VRPHLELLPLAWGRGIGPSPSTGISFLVLFLRKAGSTCVHENHLYFQAGAANRGRFQLRICSRKMKDVLALSQSLLWQGARIAPGVLSYAMSIRHHHATDLKKMGLIENL